MSFGSGLEKRSKPKEKSIYLRGILMKSAIQKIF